MFTKDNAAIIQNIQRCMDNIQECLQVNGFTPAGHGANEIIMDYGSEEISSINKEDRVKVRELVKEQLIRRGILGVSQASDNDVTDLIRFFTNSRYAGNAGDVTYVLRHGHMSLGNHNFFLSALWNFKALFDFYNEKWEGADKQRHLDVLKILAIEIASLIQDHKANYGLMCDTGARGREFYVNYLMLNFLYKNHPNWPAGKN